MFTTSRCATFLAAWCVLAFVPGCVTGPTEGYKVYGPPGSTISFQGFTPNGGTQVRIGAVAPNGATVTLGSTTVPSSDPFTIDAWGGEQYYPWELDVTPSASLWSTTYWADRLTLKVWESNGDVEYVNYDDWSTTVSQATSGYDFLSRFAKPESQNINVYSARTPFATGYAECGSGSGSCGLCLNSVDYLFLNTKFVGLRHARITWNWNLPPYGSGVPNVDGLNDHIQSIQPIPAWEQLTGNRWVVIDWQNQNWDQSKVPAPFDRGLLFAEETAPNSQNFVGRYFYQIPDAPHPAGIQVSGRYLIVAVDWDNATRHERAFVDIYDLLGGDMNETCTEADVPAYKFGLNTATGLLQYNPTMSGKPCGPARLLQRHLFDGSQGEPDQDVTNSHAGLASLTRLSDGHFLMYIANHANLGGYFYRSDATHIDANTKWRFLYYRNSTSFDVSAQMGSGSMNLIQECGSQRVYMVGLGTAPGSGANQPYPDGVVVLYSFDPSNVQLGQMNQVGTPITVAGSYANCTLRAGGGAQPMPDGTLRVYCSARGGVFDLVAANVVGFEIIDYAGN